MGTFSSETSANRLNSGCWLCWGLTSQSTIFQSCRDGAIASWVINQYFRGVECLAQGHNTAAVGLEPRTSRSGVRNSTTEPPRSPLNSGIWDYNCIAKWLQMASPAFFVLKQNFRGRVPGPPAPHPTPPLSPPLYKKNKTGKTRIFSLIQPLLPLIMIQNIVMSCFKVYDFCDPWF